MIPLIKKTFHDNEVTIDRLMNFISFNPRMSMGDYCLAFEEELSSWQGRDHAVLVNSGSSANLALLQSLLNMGRLKKGDKVGFSALTWATNVMPIIQLGLVPVPIDVEIETLNVSSRKLVEANIIGLKCLFITNLLGLCDDIDVIKEICDARGVILIEDNCESMGSIYKGKKLGNYSLASTFSFYVGHHLSTIEGGAVMTDDPDLNKMLRMVRAHGWKRDVDKDLDFYGRYTFYDLGYNLRPTEITGFLGVEGMKTIDKVAGERQWNATQLGGIYDSDKVYDLFTKHMDTYSSFSTPIVCKNKEDKEIILKRCEEAGIESRPIVGGNITSQPFFKKYVGEFDCPNAKIIHENGLYVANNPHLTEEDISEIKEALWLS